MGYLLSRAPPFIVTAVNPLRRLLDVKWRRIYRVSSHALRGEGLTPRKRRPLDSPLRTTPPSPSYSWAAKSRQTPAPSLRPKGDRAPSAERSVREPRIGPRARSLKKPSR